MPGKPLVYGQSITDACIDWPTSVAVLERLARAPSALGAGERGGGLTQVRCHR